ncbi:hypothetical protein CTAM01_01839, partial [Colletotrichum tamarilloi]
SRKVEGGCYHRASGQVEEFLLSRLSLLRVSFVSLSQFPVALCRRRQVGRFVVCVSLSRLHAVGKVG